MKVERQCIYILARPVNSTYLKFWGMRIVYVLFQLTKFATTLMIQQLNTKDGCKNQS